MKPTRDELRQWREACESLQNRPDITANTPVRWITDGVLRLIDRVEELEAALFSARHQLVAAFGLIRSHASDEHVQHYQRALVLCDAALKQP